MTIEWLTICSYVRMYNVYKVDYRGATAPKNNKKIWSTCNNVTGNSVVEQWAIYPEVAGSIPAQFQLIINFYSWASELTKNHIKSLELTCIKREELKYFLLWKNIKTRFLWKILHFEASSRVIFLRKFFNSSQFIIFFGKIIFLLLVRNGIWCRAFGQRSFIPLKTAI